MRKNQSNNSKALINYQSLIQMTLELNRADMRFGLLWLLGITTGFRLSDLLTLKPSSVSCTGLICLTERKSRKVRTFQLTGSVFLDVEFFVRLNGIQPDEFLFFSHRNRKHKSMSRQWAHRVIARTGRKYGLDSISPHSMRKTYACELFRTTGSVEAVRADLNHRYISTTLLYLKDLLSVGSSRG